VRVGLFEPRKELEVETDWRVLTESYCYRSGVCHSTWKIIEEKFSLFLEHYVT